MANLHVHLWEFKVSTALTADFERHYGPTGTWAQLFSLSPDYVGTVLLKDSKVPGRYLTIDRWRNEEAYLLFRSTHAKQYAELDNECEQLTIDERSLGAFTELPPDYSFKR